MIAKVNKDEYERDGATMQRLQPSDWDFDEKTRLLYRYIISRLNKSMYDAPMDIEDQSGLEELMVVMDKADNIPDNAVFI